MSIGYDGETLEEMILQRLQGHMVRENGLSENQFGFRKGRSTVDAIQAVVDIATKARKGTGKHKGFCALISIDLRNAFNTARWNICIEAMVRKKVPDYLLRMTDDYLSDRWVDDALVVCAAVNVGVLELRINDTLWRAKRWLDSRGLKMAPEKTGALLVTDRRSFQYLKIALGEHEIGFYLAQALSGHGCFNAYLKRFKKRDESCSYCGSLVDNAEHTLFFCAWWCVAREAVGREVDTYRVIRHRGDEDEGARWACRARQQRGPVEIASGPAPAVLRLGRIWLSATFGGGIALFLHRLARLVGWCIGSREGVFWF